MGLDEAEAPVKLSILGLPPRVLEPAPQPHLFIVSRAVAPSCFSAALVFQLAMSVLAALILLVLGRSSPESSESTLVDDLDDGPKDMSDDIVDLCDCAETERRPSGSFPGITAAEKGRDDGAPLETEVSNGGVPPIPS